MARNLRGKKVLRVSEGIICPSLLSLLLGLYWQLMRARRQCVPNLSAFDCNLSFSVYSLGRGLRVKHINVTTV